MYKEMFMHTINIVCKRRFVTIKRECQWQFPTALKMYYEMKQCIHLAQVIYVLLELYSSDVKRE